MNSISQDTNTVKIFRKLGRQKKKWYLTQIDGTGDFYFYNTTQLEKPWDLWVKSWPSVPSLSPGWFSQRQQQPETLMIQLLSCIYWIALVFKQIYSTINAWLKHRVVSLAPMAWWLPKGQCSVRTALLGKGQVGVMQEETLPASAPRAWGAPGEAPPALHYMGHGDGALQSTITSLELRPCRQWQSKQSHSFSLSSWAHSKVLFPKTMWALTGVSPNEN